MNENLSLLMQVSGQLDSVLHSILKFTDATITILDLDGCYLYVNHVIQGIKQEEIVGQPIYNYLPEDLSVQVKNNIKKVKKSGESSNYQSQFIGSDGVSRAYKHTMNPVKSNEGELQAIIITSTEITDLVPPHKSWGNGKQVATEKQQVTQELGNNEDKFQDLYKKIPIMLHSIDPQGKIVNVSDMWLKALGYREDEVIGKKSIEFLTEESRQYAEKEILPNFFENGYCHNVSYQLKKKNGEIIDVLLSATAECDNSGKILRSLAVMVDVTEKQSLILEKERREKVLYNLINATAGKRGKEYFETMVMSLGNIVHADKVFIGRIDQNKQSVNTIAHYDHGKIQTDFTYALEGTPCQNTLEETTCVYESNVAALFPNDKELQELEIEAYLGTAIYNKNKDLIGIVVALFHEPLQDSTYIRSIFELLTSSVGSEMERIDAEIALRESEQKYRFLGESTNELTCMHKPDARYLYVSPASKHLLGYEPEELIGIVPYKLFHPDDINQIVKKSYGKVLGGEAVRDVIYRIRRKDGKYIWFDTYAEPVKNVDGNVNYFITRSRDITETKIFQEKLLRKQYELKVALAHNTSITNAINNSALVSITDLNGKIIHANNVFCKVSGYSLEELLGNDHRMINSGYHPKLFWKHMWETISKGITWRDEVCNLAKDGSIYWVDTVINPIRNERGKVYQFMSVRNLITERKLSEKELLKAYDLLDKSSEAALIGTWEVDLETMQSTGNKVLKQIIEVSEDYQSNVENGLTFFKEGTSWETINRVFTDCIETGKKFDVDVQIVTAKLNEKWVRVIGIPVMEQGKCVRIYGLLQDINEKTLATQQLALQEEQFRKTYENAPSGIALVDLNGNWFKTNKSFCNILGYSKEELLALSFLDITHPEEKKFNGVLFKEMVAGKYESFQTEKRYIHKDGSTVWTTLSVAAVKNDQGQTIHFVFQINDITQKKLARIQLQEHINRLEGILDASTQVGIVETDSKGIIKTFNKGAENLLGYTAEEIVDKASPIIFHRKKEFREFINGMSDELADHLEGFDIIGALLEKGHNQTREWTFLRKNKSSFRGLLSLTPIRNAQQEIAGSLWLITDLTLIKEAEKEIQSLLDVTQAQNKRLLNFAHIVSHNLRSHTANISMILDLMQSEGPYVSDNYFLPLLKESSHNLKETISHLNEVVVMNSKTNENLSVLNLYHYVEKTIADIKVLAFDADCTIYNNVDQNLMVKAIPAYLESIILNILTNAIKYRSPKRKPTIHLSTGIHENCVILKVKDNGLGIDLKLHGAKLFGMYKTFHENKDARGIGLFITKSQVEAMGGNIEVESEIDKGTIFSIYLLNEKV